MMYRTATAQLSSSSSLSYTTFTFTAGEKEISIVATRAVFWGVCQRKNCEKIFWIPTEVTKKVGWLELNGAFNTI